MSALRKVTHEDQLARLLLTSLKEKRAGGGMINVFKILKGYDIVDAGEEFKFFQLKEGH